MGSLFRITVIAVTWAIVMTVSEARAVDDSLLTTFLADKHCPECDLSGANLAGANLIGANLSGASP